MNERHKIYAIYQAYPNLLNIPHYSYWYICFLYFFSQNIKFYFDVYSINNLDIDKEILVKKFIAE